jgi:membrane associated rhomboid family serine protease
MNFRPQSFSFLPPVIKNLLIINGLFFMGAITLQQTFGIDLNRVLGLYMPGSPDFKPHQIITSMFLHSLDNPSHIFFNMFTLWMFGVSLENIWGSKRFLIFYVVTGVGAALCHMGVNLYEAYSLRNALLASGLDLESLNLSVQADWRTALSTYPPMLRDYYLLHNIPTIGASGAVYGILMGFGMSFPNQYIYIYFLLPIKAKYLVAIFGAMELWSGLSGSTSNIAHFAHLGGMVFGFFLIRYWRRNLLI